jgi:type I restriction enzyme R subunit
MEMLKRDSSASERWLRTTAIEHKYLRPYQKEAIAKVGDGILQGKRKMMVAMATGTGKTVMTIELIHRLLASGMAKRVLFLVDRRALAAQAISSMAAFEAEPGLKFDRIYEVYRQQFKREDLDEDVFDPKVVPNEYLTAPKPGISFVYVSTNQRMRINLFGFPDDDSETGDAEEADDAQKMDIPIHAFDCIIADECHRSYTTIEESKWRKVLNYFDAVKIGLTATPAKHTKAYFEDIVYKYDYETAVREGYLVDYDPIIITSEFRMKVLFLDEGEEVQFIDTETGKVSFETLEDEREFTSSDLERVVTSPDSNRKIVREFLRYAREFEEKRGHFPKTIIFATNDLSHRSHADMIVDILRDECGQGARTVSSVSSSAFLSGSTRWMVA